MANAIASQTIVDGAHALVVKVTIVGDGSGEETDTVILDASAYTPATTNYSLWKIWYCLNGFSAFLEWDATANVHLISLALDHPHYTDYECFGGIPNDGAAGRTGDILITTAGLGAGDSGHIIFFMKKREVPKIR